MLSIIIVDDHAVVRQGVRTLIEAEPGLEVVGEAADGFEALRQAEALHPDILVLDLMMPGLGGVEVIRQIRRRSPKTRIVVLSMHTSEAYVLDALQHGAMAFVVKDAVTAELLRAIHEAAADRLYLSPPLSDRAIAAYAERAQSAESDPYEMLTDREREVLHLVADGLTNAEIGVRLFISIRTVETHRARLQHKLGLHGQAEILRFALARGLVAPPEDARVSLRSKPKTTDR